MCTYSGIPASPMFDPPPKVGTAADEAPAPDEASLTHFDLARSCAGLDNLTNTCYMNSSLVCIANVPELRDYFLSDKYKDSLRVNGMYSEKTGGDFAQLFRTLLADLWEGKFKSLRPRRFKDYVGQIEDRFAGYDQQDAMEFTEFLIDTLREDCNRVKGKKPYMERDETPGDRKDTEVASDAANYFVMRNDSFIDDLFVGFTKRLTLCPDRACGYEAFHFDPFLSLKMPMKGPYEELERRLEVCVAALGRPMSRHAISIDKRACVWDLKDAATGVASLGSCSCILAEVCKTGMDFLHDDAKLNTIKATDKLVLYEMGAKEEKIFRRLDNKPFVERLEPNDEVIVANNFMSANQQPFQLAIGMCGIVIKLDEDGDAFMDFRSVGQKHWVRRTNFCDVLKLNSERRRCPKRKDAFALFEVMRWPEFDGDFRKVQEYWLHRMEDIEASAYSACTIYFRKLAMDSNGHGASNSSFFGCNCRSRQGGKAELVGFPLLLCIPRETTAAAMRDAVRARLLHHFGNECRSGWSLYHATNARDALYTNAMAASGEEVLHLGECTHLVVQFRKVLHEQALRDFEEIAKIRLKEHVIPIQTCFDWCVATEQLKGDNKVECSGCKKKHNIITRNEIWSLPPVLVLHLKRFEFDSYCHMKRLDRGVSYPLEGLDLTRFARGAESFPEGKCLRAGKEVEIHGLESDAGKLLNGLRGTAMYLDTNTKRFCVRIKEEDPFEDWKKVQPKNLKPVRLKVEREAQPLIYDLVSLGKHLGRPGFGHYVAYARSSEDGLWRMYDDDDVREVKPETVESEHVGCYFLVYLRRDLRPASWGPPKMH